MSYSRKSGSVRNVSNIAPEASIKYLQNVILHPGKVPIEVLRPIFAELVFQESEIEVPQCPKCSTPLILGHYKTSLLKRPKKTQLIKTLLRKERKRRVQLKNSEKLKLSLFRSQRNTLKIVCHVCRHKTKHYCSLPEEIKKPLLLEKKQLVKVKQMKKVLEKTTDGKKKKRKRSKEQNAGLLISPLIERDVSERVADTIKVNGKPNKRQLLNNRVLKGKERQIMEKNLKLKLEKDAAMNLKKDTLGGFLSSLV